MSKLYMFIWPKVYIFILTFIGTFKAKKQRDSTKSFVEAILAARESLRSRRISARFESHKQPLILAIYAEKQRGSAESFVKAILDRLITGMQVQKKHFGFEVLGGALQTCPSERKRTMESLMQKLSIILASDSELWKEIAIVAENVLMSGTRYL